MNLNDLKKLSDGDYIKFNIPFPAFTAGKQYPIKETKIGTMVCDDSRKRWWFLYDNSLNERFSIIEK